MRTSFPLMLAALLGAAPFGSTTLNIIGLAATGLTYTAAQNHDPEADSNGTAITVRKP